MSWRAMVRGMGVSNPSQNDEILGVSPGTVKMRLFKPLSAA